MRHKTVQKAVGCCVNQKDSLRANLLYLFLQLLLALVRLICKRMTTKLVPVSSNLKCGKVHFGR